MAEIQDNDVLCGRGGATNNHTGNRLFRELVGTRQSSYLTARKRDKKLIAQEIVDQVRQRGGRFLKRDYVNGLEDWVDIGDKKAGQKTAQALREGLDVWGKSHVTDRENKVRGNDEKEDIENGAMPPTKQRRKSGPHYEEGGGNTTPLQPHRSSRGSVQQNEQGGYNQWGGYGQPIMPALVSYPNQIVNYPSHYGPYHHDQGYQQQWQQQQQHEEQGHEYAEETSPARAQAVEGSPLNNSGNGGHPSVHPGPYLASPTVYHTDGYAFSQSDNDGCTCKKSLCLKLYCQCFASSKHCESKCRCVNCQNTVDNNKDIDRARMVILRKNPSAFQAKFEHIHTQVEHDPNRPPHMYPIHPETSGPEPFHYNMHQTQPHPAHPSWPQPYPGEPGTVPPTASSWDTYDRPPPPYPYHPPPQGSFQPPPPHPDQRQDGPILFLAKPSQTTTQFLQDRENINPTRSNPSNHPILVHKLGCKCRKTSCVKKYCECFQRGVRCGDTCQCKDCKNHLESSESSRESSFMRFATVSTLGNAPPIVTSSGRGRRRVAGKNIDSKMNQMDVSSGSCSFGNEDGRSHMAASP